MKFYNQISRVLLLTIKSDFSFFHFVMTYNAKPTICRLRQRDGRSVGVERSRRAMGFVLFSPFLLVCTKHTRHPKNSSSQAIFHASVTFFPPRSTPDTTLTPHEHQLVGSDGLGVSWQARLAISGGPRWRFLSVTSASTSSCSPPQSGHLLGSLPVSWISNSRPVGAPSRSYIQPNK